MSLIKWEPLNDIEAMVDRAFSWPSLRLGNAINGGNRGRNDILSNVVDAGQRNRVAGQRQKKIHLAHTFFV